MEQEERGLGSRKLPLPVREQIQELVEFLISLTATKSLRFKWRGNAVAIITTTVWELEQALVQRRSCSRRFAARRTPPPGRCLATRPVTTGGRRAGSVNSGQNNIASIWR